MVLQVVAPVAKELLGVQPAAAEMAVQEEARVEALAVVLEVAMVEEVKAEGQVQEMAESQEAAVVEEAEEMEAVEGHRQDALAKVVTPLVVAP